MPITYAVNRLAGYIVETWTGTIRIEDLSAHWKVYLADADVLAVRRTLVDLRGATVAFSGAELSRAIAAIVVPALGGLSWRSALVVANPVQFGTSRQYQVFADHYSHDAIFDGTTTALDWLLSE